MVFNKQLPSEEAYKTVQYKIQEHLGEYKHPQNLTKEDIAWLKKNIIQFDQKVLDEIITNSILPDKPREAQG